jgi:hypothetical protein
LLGLVRCQRPLGREQLGSPNLIDVSFSASAFINSKQQRQHLGEFPHPPLRSRTATHVRCASPSGSHIERETRRKRQTRCTSFRAAGGRRETWPPYIFFLVVPEWHITLCLTNGLLARCIMQLPARTSVTLSLRASFIRLSLCGMVTSLDTACIEACIGPQCNVAIASLSDRLSTSCNPTTWGQ